MHRAPARPVRACLVRALCELVALLSKNMTCTRPHCNATPSEDFLHTSQCRLHIMHFTSHTSSHLKLHFSNFLHTASFYTEKLLHTEALTQSKLLHREALTQRSSCTQQVFAHRSLHTASFYLHTEAFTHSKL